MKLIDAEKYGKSLQESLDNAKRWKEKAIKAGAGDEIVIRAQASIDMLVECLLRLKEQQEVEAPKCGEWMDNGANYKCSNCGHTESYYDMNYCPCCGERMT